MPALTAPRGSRRQIALIAGICTAISALGLPSVQAVLGVPAAQAAPIPAAKSTGVTASRLTVGDSITVGASSLLQLAGFQVNGKIGRQFSKAPAILRSYGSQLPTNVVIELGTNGYVAARDCRRVLAIAGPTRRVFFVNNRMNRSWQDANNRTLRNCVAASDGRATLVDWYSASADAWDWFAPDRVHLTRSGSLALTTLIDAMVDFYGAPAQPITSPS